MVYVITIPPFIHHDGTADDRIQIDVNTKWPIFYHRSPEHNQSWQEDEETEGGVCVN